MLNNEVFDPLSNVCLETSPLIQYTTERSTRSNSSNISGNKQVPTPPIPFQRIRDFEQQLPMTVISVAWDVSRRRCGHGKGPTCTVVPPGGSVIVKSRHRRPRRSGRRRIRIGRNNHGGPYDNHR
ncbi:hypothetical protein LSAT2_000445 [Lamellibrachia satsuma]|nr:hypothetical protein LSAT2_000445 [Lamellibrachia satsuma]